ncbi:endo-1,3;1,4-beta-D-glucanase-like isoform X2 [Telopea speciosissima]|uniref:endo-1,3;1,4-beta-D-glucanase-like isoform X2 n=1 Tax=Telopea speciosissima TaxID=54955 RepID=UPI001CC6EFEA|nr:endo-1,3;1,4-beta-D-glucanase-like isoform X2 [Telopea speciosissima]
MAGPQCCDNPPALNPNSGEGIVEEFGGLLSYITGSSGSKAAILLVSDVFGFEAPNLRKLADKIAAVGYYVVVPEFMHGDPYDPNNKERPIMDWIKDHGVDKGFEEAKPIVSAIKSRCFSTIGAAGFCWGGKVVVELAKAGYIQAAVICHPPLVTVDDIKEVKAPIAVLGAEIDEHSPPELLKQFEGVLSVDGYVKIFPGVAHGWTVRYDVADKKAVEPAEEAHQDMLDWFAKYVK